MFRFSHKNSTGATNPKGYVRLALLLTFFAASVLPQAVMAQVRISEPDIKPLSSGPQTKAPASCTNPRAQPIRFWFQYQQGGTIDSGTWYGQGMEIGDEHSNDPCLEYHNGDTQIDADTLHLSCSEDFPVGDSVGNGFTIADYSIFRIGSNGGQCGTSEFPGELIIQKVTDPSGSSTSFDFSSPTGDIGTFSLSGGQSQSFFVDPGTHEVTETVPGGWELTAIDCSDSDLGANKAIANVVKDQVLTCTFTNTEVAANPSIDIEKATNGQDADSPTGPVLTVGDAVTWTYVVTNTGDVALSSVTVTDDQNGSVSCPKTTLAVGESMTCTDIGTATLGQYANVGTATGTHEATDVSDTDPSHYFGEAAPQPGISITKDDSQTSVAEGSSYAYTLSYANTGNVDLTGVVITDTVPANTTFNAGLSDSGWSCSEGDPAGTVCSITIGSLLADGSEDGSVAFGVNVDDDLQVPDSETGQCPGDPGLQVNNTGNITDGGETVSDSDSDVNDITTSCTDLEPGISITKDDGNTSVAEGSSFAYTLSYANTGDLDLTGVVITDSVPANTTFNAALSDSGWSCSEGDPAGTVCSITIGSLPADGSADGSVAFGVNVDDDLQVPDSETGQCPGDPGLQVDNTGTISDDSDPAVTDSDSDVNDITTSCTDLEPGLSITKDDGQTSVDEGSSYAYTLSYENTGEITLNGVTITDTVPANTTFNAALSDAGWDCSEGDPVGTVCTINVGNLDPEDTGSVAFGVNVHDNLVVPDPQTGECPAEPPTFVVDNEGTIQDADQKASDSDDDVNDINTSCTDLEASLSVVKRTNGEEIREGFCDQNTIVVGEAVSWTYAVTNTGDQPLDITSIIDDAGTPGEAGDDFTPDFVDGDSGNNVLDPGETWNYQASGTAEAGEYSNTVTVEAEVLGSGQQEVAAKAEVGTIVESSDLSGYCGVQTDLAIEKTDAVALVTEGSSLVYTLSYENLGSTDATGVVITETVPVNTTFSAGDSTTGWSCADGSAAGTVCEFSVGSVAAGGTGQVQFGLTVDDELRTPDPETGECPADEGFLVDNTASITDDGANGPDANPDNNQDSEDTPIATQCESLQLTPSISIEKSPDRQTLERGDTANFTITVTNDGELDLINVSVNDPESPDCKREIGDLAAGAVEIYNCQRTNVLQGFTNVATVTGETEEGGSVSDSDDAVVAVFILDEPQQQHHTIPTMSQWSLILMAGLMLMLGLARAREWTRR